MKFPLLAAAVALALGSSLANAAGGLDTDAQKSSYAIGLTTAQSIARQGVAIDVQAFMQGVKDAVEGNQPQLTQGLAASIGFREEPPGQPCRPQHRPRRRPQS